MKINYLTRSIPILSTLLIIIMLCFSNQSENSKIKILIWNTPSLPIGTYLAISTGTGFIFSYICTTYLSRIYQPKLKEVIKYRFESNDKDSNQNITNHDNFYDNTLIERDINDPSPTLNASFRIISKPQRTSYSKINNQQNLNEMSNSSYESEYQSNDKEAEYANEYEINNKLNDWDDNSYASW
tara:strand:- start:632 stop:1183 length:552 start_codon:yes stop_codon:yes gene_type:complete